MEKNIKRVGKFNIVDVIAVVLILGIVAFGCWKFLNRGEAVEEETVPITYMVRVENVPEEVYENCLKHLPAKLMASGALLNGEIESVEKLPYLVPSDGTFVEDPDHVTLLFTVHTVTPVRSVMTTKVGDQEIRIGKSDHILKSEYIEFSKATIVDVRWGE